jgi:SAM-dependent methyltransferase
MTNERDREEGQPLPFGLSRSLNPKYCPFCNHSKLTALPSPKEQCMRSDSLIVHEPLIKIGCLNCGVLLGRNSQSDTRYQRSLGNSPFDFERHKKVATGLVHCFEQLSGKEDLKILEIGAANFHTALVLKQLKPNYYVTALERHPESTPETNDIFVVEKDFFEFNTNQKFNICYSNQVIEHFDDPIAFLQHAKELITENGHIVACCPTSSVASNELLFADHITHFTADAMSICASRAGLVLVAENVSDWDPLTHIYIFENATQTNIVKRSNASSYEPLFRSRFNLLDTWLNEDARMSNILLHIDAVTIYGAGEFTQLIRAYLPNIWSKVEQIVVDNLNGARSFDRPVLDFNEIKLDPEGIFLIGAHKQSQPVIRKKLVARGIPEDNIICLSV